MSVGDERKPLSGADIAAPPITFQVTVYGTGQLNWKSPKTGDPAIDEMLLRGWLDKIRETILDQIKSGGRIVT